MLLPMHHGCNPDPGRSEFIFRRREKKVPGQVDIRHRRQKIPTTEGLYRSSCTVEAVQTFNSLPPFSSGNTASEA